MTNQSTSWISIFTLASVVFGGAVLMLGGCNDESSRRRMAGGIGTRKTDDTAFLVEAVAEGLNSLPREIVLDLSPPQPILDDAKSADGQPVLAVCSTTPNVESGIFNFFSVPKGNANFREVGVRPGDKLRFFAKYDQDTVEHGFGEVDYFEMDVRRLDQFNPDNALIVEGGLNGAWETPTRIEIWRFSDKRMNEIQDRIDNYLTNAKPAIGWEPSADESALLQLVERANQWLRNAEEGVSWKADPRIEKLPQPLQESKSVARRITAKELSVGVFQTPEARELQQAIWLRDISRWAKGEAVSPLDVAAALFDWTIRNIQLEDPEKSPGYVHQPWQVLLYGHGSAEQRAWIFTELCRHQQLDVVMLAVNNQWWLPALLHEGELYLFDSRLGLPIPGEDAGQICTLTDLRANPDLLSALNIEGEEDYPVTTDDLKDVTAWLVASPLQLSKRALALQEAFEGDEFVVLFADTVRIGQEIEKTGQFDQVQLWPYPFESILAERSMSPIMRGRAGIRFFVFAQAPQLWKARVLHFQGTKDVPFEERNDPLARPERGHQQATALYQHPRVRITKSVLKDLVQAKRMLYERSKADASYWLGLLSYDLGKYRIAEDWLARRTLEARPDGPWTTGARYNLARTYEAMGRLPKAIELLESDDSPQRLGNLIRAQRLKTQLNLNAEANTD